MHTQQCAFTRCGAGEGTQLGRQRKAARMLRLALLMSFLSVLSQQSATRGLCVTASIVFQSKLGTQASLEMHDKRISATAGTQAKRQGKFGMDHNRQPAH